MIVIEFVMCFVGVMVMMCFVFFLVITLAAKEIKEKKEKEAEK